MRPLHSHVELTREAVPKIMRSDAAACRALKLGVCEQEGAGDPAIACRVEFGMLAMLRAHIQPLQGHEPLPDQLRSLSNADIVIHHTNKKDSLQVWSWQSDDRTVEVIDRCVMRVGRTPADCCRHLRLAHADLDSRLEVWKVEQLARREDLDSHDVWHRLRRFRLAERSAYLSLVDGCCDRV